MKILYSAFECNPSRGSDAYVGWSWAKQMSIGNEVHVLTSSGNKGDIEKYIAEKADVRASFHYVSLPRWMEMLLTGRKGYFTTYVIWQWYAFKEAQRLHEIYRFDIAHHVSIADFRIIGFLWKLGIPYVYGPVGGGQETPVQLGYYVRDYQKQEKVRSWINRLAISLPAYKNGIQKAAKVFVSNDETLGILERHIGCEDKYTQMCELGIDTEYLDARAGLQHNVSEKVHLLISGRMMYRKGIELLLDALTKLETETPYVVDLYGGGHQANKVKQQITERNLDEVVIMHGKIPFEEMLKVYACSDVFVLPSLRETTGTAVVEAMANKLPVVALNQNGVKYLVKKDAGMLVEIQDKETTICEFANALKTLIENPCMRIDMGNTGYKRLLMEYTWESKAKQMSEYYESLIQ